MLSVYKYKDNNVFGNTTYCNTILTEKYGAIWKQGSYSLPIALKNADKLLPS